MLIEEIQIQNFKSIPNLSIELGRVNVFIGENGCGKSNILEAIGFLSTSKKTNGANIDNDILASKGIRIAKSALMRCAFLQNRDSIKIIAKGSGKNSYNVSVETILDGEDMFFDTDISLEELKYINSNEEFFLKMTRFFGSDFITKYLIYSLNTPALRGFTRESKQSPVGIHGENLDVLIANLSEEEQQKLRNYAYLIPWLEDFMIDGDDRLRLQGFKPNMSDSRLYFKDKFMSGENNIFSSENANEGVLHLLFYLGIMISKKTPSFFAIDNIESCLNPHLCQHLMKELCALAKSEDKQILVTTHNPAILDGLNLFDDEIRLFEVKRNDAGHTTTRRIKLKPQTEHKHKLSELWTRGFLGAISKEF